MKEPKVFEPKVDLPFLPSKHRVLIEWFSAPHLHDPVAEAKPMKDSPWEGWGNFWLGESLKPMANPGVMVGPPGVPATPAGPTRERPAARDYIVKSVLSCLSFDCGPTASRTKGPMSTVIEPSCTSMISPSTVKSLSLVLISSLFPDLLT